MSAQNLLRNDQVDEAATLSVMKQGNFSRLHYLGVLVYDDTPAWGNRSHRIEVAQVPTDNGIVFNDDRHVGHAGIGTHIDGLGHVEHNGVYHGGHTTADVFQESGLRELGVAENYPVVHGPFKMLDMARYLKHDVVPGGYEYTVEDIEGAMIDQNVTIEEGDIVALRSGWIKNLHDETFLASEPGLGHAAATFLAAKKPKLIAADTVALEVQAVDGWKDYPVHKFLVKDEGILIGEVWNLEKLARENIHQGLIFINPPLIGGLAQAQVNPLLLC